MPIHALQFPIPIRRPTRPTPRDHARRDRAIELFDAGEAVAAVQESLAYLLPDSDVSGFPATPLRFPQGAASIEVVLEGDALRVTASIATINDRAATTAALRFFLSRLSSTGQMFQPRLRDNAVNVEYRDPVNQVHPTKLIEVVQRLAQEASRHDRWLSERFGISVPDHGLLTPLDAEELPRAIAIWRTHWSEVDELVMESRRRRSLRVLDTLGSLAINRTRYLLSVHGDVRARLVEFADTFTDRDEDGEARDAALAKCVKQMLRVSDAELANAFAHTEYSINPLRDGSDGIGASLVANPQRMQHVGDLRSAGQLLEATLELSACYVYALAQYSWPEPLERRLREALDQASGKPWREAAQSLWSHAQQIGRDWGANTSGNDRDQIDNGDDYNNSTDNRRDQP